MPIDISNVSQEKRAFLKASGLLESLEEAIPRKIAEVQTRRNKRKDGNAEWQKVAELGEKERVEYARLKKKLQKLKQQTDSMRNSRSHTHKEMRQIREKMREYEYRLDPTLLELNQKLEDRCRVKTASMLVCPVCGEGDHGNRHDGKPWCFKCNTPLVPKSKVNKWLKTAKVKQIHAGLRDELRKITPGFDPEDVAK